MNASRARLILIVVAILALSGCAHQSRYAGDGVYYQPYSHYYPAARTHVYAVNPMLYPYWSLDWFYFSRHYHPYSVLVGYHDPWFYPYPGWYYGYRPWPRSGFAFSYGYYYPWYARGPYYLHHRPWQASAYIGYWHHSHGGSTHQPPPHRTEVENLRLRQLDRRHAMIGRDHQPYRGQTWSEAHKLASSRPATPGHLQGTSLRRADRPTQAPARTTRSTSRGVEVIHHDRRDFPQDARQAESRLRQPESAPPRQVIPPQQRSRQAPPVRQEAPRSRSSTPPSRPATRSGSRPATTTSRPSTPERSTRGRVRDRE